MAKHWIHKVKPVLPALAILAWFAANTWRALFSGLDGDDLMNIYQAWKVPLREVIFANLTPFTSFYRPLGSAYYRTFHWSYGLNPLPYRVFTCSLLLLNVGLAFWAVRRLTKSAELALLTCLLWSYHVGLVWIYTSNGTIYDTMCFTFFALSLGIYAAQRESGFSWIGYAAFLVCDVLALNSKEMAVAIPVVLLAWELLFLKGPLFTRKALRERTLLWVCCAVTLGAVLAKTSGASVFTGNQDYAVHVSLHQYFSTQIPLVRELFELPGHAMNTFFFVTILAAITAFGVVLKNRAMLFAVVLIFVTPLPINFINYRGFAVMYIPLLGWALFFGCLLMEMRDWAWKGIWKLPTATEGMWGLERVALFLATLYLVFQFNIGRAGWPVGQRTPEMNSIAELTKGAKEMYARYPNAQRIMLLYDGFEMDTYDPLFIVRLTYNNQMVEVDRMKNLSRLIPNVKDDVTVAYCSGKYMFDRCDSGSN